MYLGKLCCSNGLWCSAFVAMRLFPSWSCSEQLESLVLKMISRHFKKKIILFGFIFPSMIPFHAHHFLLFTVRWKKKYKWSLNEMEGLGGFYIPLSLPPAFPGCHTWRSTHSIQKEQSGQATGLNDKSEMQRQRKNWGGKKNLRDKNYEVLFYSKLVIFRGLTKINSILVRFLFFKLDASSFPAPSSPSPIFANRQGSECAGLITRPGQSDRDYFKLSALFK